MRCCTLCKIIAGKTFFFKEALRNVYLKLVVGYAPTMMLLMGMWMSLTKKPMKPIIAKPIAVANAIFWYSANRIIDKNVYLTLLYSFFLN